MDNRQMSYTVKRKISNYFIGDSTETIYKYRTGNALVEFFEKKFGISTLVAGPSRWTLCLDTIDYMYEKGSINDFFTTLLSNRSISKELDELDTSKCAIIRKDAIDHLNVILNDDDLKLIDHMGKLMLVGIDDEAFQIGEGGFAKVYKMPNSDKVTKKLKDEFKGNAGIISRFKYEYILVSENLNGIKGIIKAYSYDENEISYTMEYCDCDLKSYILNNNLNDNQKISLIQEILEIMNNVHDKKVIHRDLSPKNIFIKEGHPIIADFGLGKAIDENGRTYVTVDTSMNGTLEYCDPRLFQGLASANEQSDIYSLGRIINFIMTRNSDTFKHSLSLVSTMATQASLDSRYHSIKEMITKINSLTVNKIDTEYKNRCKKLIVSGYYDASMDEYLLSFDEDALIEQLNDKRFKIAYKHIISNPSYNDVMVDRFNALYSIFKSPFRHTFALFDEINEFCVDVLRDYRNISVELKTILGNCIYEITIGINRWKAQAYFSENYMHIESEYIQDTINQMNNWR